MALRGSNRQIRSHRVEHCHTDQIYENSRREQSWLQAELGNRERAHQETRSGTLQDIEELKRICCTEADRPQQLRINEISRKERESQSTVNQSAHGSNSGLTRKSELSE